MRIIDAHMHVELGGCDMDQILQSMDRKAIEMSWLLTWEEINPPIAHLHMDLPPEPILEACETHPDRFIPFYAPDPASEDLEEKFSKYKELGFRGCGELKVSKLWEDPLIESYLELVSRYGFCLVFHMESPRQQFIQERDGRLEWLLERLLNDKFNGVSRHYITNFAERTGILKKKIRRNSIPFPGILFDFESLESRIRQFPDIRFIGHGPDFWNHISTFRHPKHIHQKGSIREFGIIDRLLEQYDNFFCDISGTSGFNALNRDRRQSRIFLSKHAHKIMYGSDNTRFPLLELLYSLNPGQEKMDLILHQNARKVLDS